MTTYTEHWHAQHTQLIASLAASISQLQQPQPQLGAARDERLSQLQRALASLTSSTQADSSHALAQVLDDAFPPLQGARASPVSPDVDVLELIVLLHASAAANALAARTCLAESAQLAAYEAHWRALAGSSQVDLGWRAVQTAPRRALSVIRLVYAALAKEYNAAVKGAVSWRETFTSSGVLLPARNVVLEAMFPHLASSHPSSTSTSTSTTSRSFLSLKHTLPPSPLTLVRQEAAHKRASMQAALDDSAQALGQLARSAARSSQALSDMLTQREPASVAEHIKDLVWRDTLAIDDALALPGSPSAPPDRLSVHFRARPTLTADLAASLVTVLRLRVKSHVDALDRALSSAAPPSRLERSWPLLVSAPVVSLIAGRAAWTNRERLAEYAALARDTLSGFVRDWLVDPLRQIIDTVRARDAQSMLTGRESLESDLGSLERMVIDFAADQHAQAALEPAQVDALRDRVRQGDLTTILKAWEQDIKSPIRSAVAGTLVRTLLIQVQKVKVDVDLAMSGIERMLASQQLTFAFVGVAPSLLVLVGAYRAAKALVSGRVSARRALAGSRAKRHRLTNAWLAVRTVDKLTLSRHTTKGTERARADGQEDDDEAKRQGHVLIALARLRAVVLGHSRGSGTTSSHGALRDMAMRDAFIDDVAALEMPSLFNATTTTTASESKSESSPGAQLAANVARLWRWLDVLERESSHR